jgi:hypothetical protein
MVIMFSLVTLMPFTPRHDQDDFRGNAAVRRKSSIPDARTKPISLAELEQTASFQFRPWDVIWLHQT